MKIAIIGLGYVGLSSAILLSQKYDVVGVDLDYKKILLINSGCYPLTDDLFSMMLSVKQNRFSAVHPSDKTYLLSDLFIIALPTNFSKNTDKGFDTTLITNYIKEILDVNSNAVIVIKSTVPIGFTNDLNETFKTNSILFSPEFLRENTPLYDTFYPNKIILSNDNLILAKKVLKIFQSSLQNNEVKYLLMSSSEAETTKLFSNAYLSMRVAFFNELDTFAEMRGLDTSLIIQAMENDPRIGKGYNNPSFGYGGYCLPKDTLALAHMTNGMGLTLIGGSIHKSNEIRKKHITNMVIKEIGDFNSVGVYRLVMKKNSRNFRNSSILYIIEYLLENDIEVIIYEPLLNTEDKIMEIANRCTIETDLTDFKTNSNLVIANRLDDDIEDIKYKVYTRDIFNIN